MTPVLLSPQTMLAELGRRAFDAALAENLGGTGQRHDTVVDRAVHARRLAARHAHPSSRSGS